MAELLYRIGRFAARRHWAVIGAWLAVLAVTVVTYLSFAGALSSSISLPDTPTTRVSQQLEEEFEGTGGGNGAIVAETTDGSAFTAEQQRELVTLFDRVAEVESVADVSDPFATQDQLDSSAEQVADGRRQLNDGLTQLSAGQAQIDAGRQALAQQRAQAREDGTLAAVRPQLEAAEQQLDDGQAELDRQQAKVDEQAPQLEQGETLSELSSAFRTVSADGSAAVANVTFDVSTNEVTAEVKTEIEDLVADADIDGVALYPSQDIAQTVPSILGPGEVAGVVIAAIVLFVMLGTVLGAALPLVTALLGVGVASLASLSFSGMVEFVSVTPVLGVMLGLAVGIDYSLFIINRHRRQLMQGADAARVDRPGQRHLGQRGRLRRRHRHRRAARPQRHRRRVPRPDGHRRRRRRPRRHPDGRHAHPGDPLAGRHAHPAAPRARAAGRGRAYARRGDHRPRPADEHHPGVDRPRARRRRAARRWPHPPRRCASASRTARPSLRTLPATWPTRCRRRSSATGPTVRCWSSPTCPARWPRTTSSLSRPPWASSSARSGTSTRWCRSARRSTVRHWPSRSSRTVHRRASRPRSWSTTFATLTPTTSSGADATLGVAGNASAGIDISEQLSDVLPTYLALVVGLSVLILVLVFRSILVPLTATLGFVLSLLAAFGGITAIFQIGFLSDLFGVHAPGPVLSFLPIIATGILFGLAMDYQLFLVSGMREAYAHGAPARVAVQHGLHAGRSVVTAAAIIMISVFAGFIFSHDATIKPIGFGLAFGVLVDAFVVRMLLIPAAMHLLGETAWWLPRWLDRILPDVDVEGAKLERSHPVHAKVDDRSTSTPAPTPHGDADVMGSSGPGRRFP